MKISPLSYKKALFLIAPVVLLFIALMLTNARGPFWSGHIMDPDYTYLISSVRFITGQPIIHTDHPGTPVQVVGGIAIKIIYQLRVWSSYINEQNIVNDVIVNSELYLNYLNILLLSFILLMVFFSAFIIYKRTNQLLPAILIQFSPLLLGQELFDSFTRFTPEPMLVFTAMLLLTFLICLFLSKKQVKLKHIVLVGLIAGLGVAVKVTFLPLILLPLVFFSEKKHFLIYPLACLLGFVFFTIPIYEKYIRVLNWLSGIAVHEGLYGGGAASVIAPFFFVKSLAYLFINNPSFAIIFFLTLGVLLKFFFKTRDKKNVKNNKDFIRLSGIFIVEIIGIIITAKHYYVNRYFIPTLMLSGINLYFLILFIENYFALPNKKMGLIILFVVLSSVNGAKIYHEYTYRTEMKLEIAQIKQRINTEYDDYLIIQYVRASSKYLAFFQTSNYGGLDLSAIKNEFKNRIFYNERIGKYLDINRELVDITKRIKNNEKIIFQGTPFDKGYKNFPQDQRNKRYLKYFPEEFTLKDVFHGKYETIYVAKIKK